MYLQGLKWAPNKNELGLVKFLLVCLYPIVREAPLLHWSTLHFNTFSESNVTYLELLDELISQIVEELPRTIKGQNWVEFDLQSI